MLIRNDFAGSKLLFYANEKSSCFLSDFFEQFKEIDQSSIRDFLLFGTILPPRSPLNGVRSLYPGEIREGEKVRFETAELDTEILNWNLEKFVDTLDRLLFNYFQQYANIEKTLFLSGGIDSSILLSYLGKNTRCITWGGWGEKTTDVTYAKISAANFGVKEHHFVYADYESDVGLYQKAVLKSQIPLLFCNVIPFLKMSLLAVNSGGGEIFMGQNADTIFCSYPPIIKTRKLSLLNNLLPFNPLFFSPNRKRYLFSTKSPVRLMAYFKSNGLFPGPWIDVDNDYFLEKERAINNIIKKGDISQRIIMIEELLTESRRNQIVQNYVPALYGANINCPYYQKEIVQLAIKVPQRLRRKDNYDKVILKELAKKRGVPAIIIEKGKKGLSYNYRDIIGRGLHLDLWNKMEKNDFLNNYLNVKMLRGEKQDDFFSFDMLRSLYCWHTLVAKPNNLF